MLYQSSFAAPNLGLGRFHFRLIVGRKLFYSCNGNCLIVRNKFGFFGKKTPIFGLCATNYVPTNAVIMDTKWRMDITLKYCTFVTSLTSIFLVISIE